MLHVAHHTIQLAIGDAFNSEILGVNISDVLDKCKKLAASVKRSPLMLNELKTVCKDINLQYISLKPANATRWNSTASNTDSVIHLEPALHELFTKSDVSEKWGTYEMTNQEWRIIKGVNKVLVKVRICSKTFESDKPTIFLVIPKLFELQDFLEKFESDRLNDR